MLIERITLWPNREDVALTTYVTPPDPDWPFPADPCPAILICPGGAYLNLSPAEGESMALALSARGYQTFVLEYSVGSRVARAEEARYPAQLIDLAKAMALIRENNGRWNLDPQRVAVMGFSAGGHLCASYAVHWHEDWLAQEAGTESEQLRPAAAVLGYPITDYVLQADSFPELNPMMAASTQTLFGTAKPAREELERLSPCRHVSGKTPPVFLFHAADDGLVPVGNSLHMAEALGAAGVPFELHVFQQGDHGFANGHPKDRPWESHRDRACAEWMELVQTWLLKQFASETMEPPLPPAEEFFRAKAARQQN